MIGLASRDPQSTIYQFYNASADMPDGMSKLSVRHIINGSPRVVVITVTLWAKDPTRSFEDSVFESLTDDVFGIAPIAV